jgi:23S rRNA-/tRNA-specific pseudouridylate synthase
MIIGKKKKRYSRASVSEICKHSLGLANMIPLHRLDLVTSGVLLGVCDASHVNTALEFLADDPHVAKKYIARCIDSKGIFSTRGAVIPPHVDADETRTTFTISAPLCKADTTSQHGKRAVRSDEGVNALTVVTVRHHAASSVVVMEEGERAMEVEIPASVIVCCELRATGRQHQIRAHLAHVGAPIVGDVEYGGFPLVAPALARENEETKESCAECDKVGFMDWPRDASAPNQMVILLHSHQYSGTLANTYK